MASYTDQLEMYSGLHAQSLRTDALIKMETQKADLYDKTISELEAEKRLTSEKLEALERIVASLSQQASQLREDIATGEQFATCFTMRSLVDQQDVPAVGRDLEARRQIGRQAQVRVGETAQGHVVRRREGSRGPAVRLDCAVKLRCIRCR